jgi:hypothetical protein
MEMAMKSMETAVESMEMAPGALPHPGRVPEQRLLSPESRRWRQRSCRTSSRKLPNHLGFSCRREGRGGGLGPPHHRVARPGVHPRTPWCDGSLAPLQLSFGLCPASRKNRRFGLCFIQFREYFLCNFFETQKQQKTGNWHCGISSTG